MAPKKQRTQASSSGGVTDSQIAQWLYDRTAVERWQKIKSARIFEGSFLIFSDFEAYRLRELALQTGFFSLLDYTQNSQQSNHLMVKLFYANLNLGHQRRQNRENCVWSLVCGKEVWFSLDRIAHILQSPS